MSSAAESMPDAELVSAVANGDMAALAVLYDRHAAVVYRAAFRRLGDHRTAEEVVQDVWLTLWDRARMFDAAQGTLPAWLGAIARNRATDRLRAMARRPGALPMSVVFATSDEADRAVATGAALTSGSASPDPETIVDELALRGAMTGAMATLSPDERTVLELAYYGELSQSEIADRLGIPLGTVKTRTRRALTRLRGALAVQGDSAVPGVEEPSGAR